MNRFSGDSGTILVVDDELANVQVVGTMLAAFGYDLMIAQDGDQALERVKAKTPDLVLLDIFMPGKNGLEVCRDLHALPEMEDVPVIFLSADGEKSTIVKALETGGVDYITKPFNKAELIARVRSHLELKKTRVECRHLLRKAEHFLEIMAHDLRNWVGSSHFSAQLLDETDGLPEQARRLSSTIKESSAQALRFIDEYLANARAAGTTLEIERKIFDLAARTRACACYHQDEARAKDITVACDVPEGPLRVKSDRVAVARVIENLVTNAIKFSPPGSTVTVALEPEPVALTVRDEGPGFSDSDREQLFQPYTRLSARPTAGEVSTGLGLAIIKQLCDLLDIAIEVERPAKGASIRLTFPKG
ncbi:MAG: hybrid sensor histidine kinase/response regulator [Verrucomicrobiaceae bacterium]|nr:hybrid sensor histidine kinase/response regulator [Verrucomicrobiaceae bacterium]